MNQKKILQLCTSTLLALSSLTLVSCSSTSEIEEPNAHEIPTSKTPKIDLSQEELYDTAKRLYANNLYTVAIENLQSLKEGFAQGPYSEFAEIKIADANFEASAFDVAAPLYEDFVKTHPSSRANPYMLLKAARCFELMNKGVGRDVAPLEKSKETYEKLLSQYPDTIYADTAKKYHASLVQRLAEHEQLIADFYRRNDDESEAASARDKFFKENWQQTLKNAKQEQSRLEKTDKISPTEETLSEENEVQEDTSEQAYRYELEERTPGQTVYRKVPIVIKDLDSKPIPQESLKLSTYKIEKIECDTKNNAVFIFLNTDFKDTNFLRNFSLITPKNSNLIVKIPDTTAQKATMNCFAQKDLSVLETGLIALKVNTPMSLIALSNPPRLVLASE